MNEYDSDSTSQLSSPMSRSPTPPSELYASYPSPISSQLSSLGSTPSPEGMETPQSSQCDEDGAPPAKRRKLSEPKPRTTEKLDLSSGAAEEGQKAQLDRLLKVLYKKRKIVVVAGAGISVSAGIPDFRSSTGLFKTLKSEHNLKSSGKDLFDASVYKDDRSTSSFHAMVRNLSTATKSASATPFHHLLATLAQEGRLLRLYTQNVDGIDTSLPPLATQIPLGRKAPWPKTIQLHGCLEKMVCTKCHQCSDLDPVLFDGPVPPACKNCEETDGVRTQHAGKRSHGVGRLRPRMVLYNEHNPDDEAIGSVVKADLRTRPDALLVVGTTLKVPGVKRIVREMCGVVRDRKDGGMTIWINNDQPPVAKDLGWDLVVQGPCDYVAAHAALRRWDEEEVHEVSDEQLKKVKEESGTVEVVVLSPTKNKLVERIQGVITPAPSPRLVPQKANGKIISTVASTKPKQLTTAASKKAKSSKSSAAPKANKASAPKKRQSAAAKKPTIASSGIRLSFKVSKTSIAQKTTKDSPDHIKVQSQPGGKRAETSAQPMQPVSPSALRNNSYPPFQTPTALRKTYCDADGVPIKGLTVKIPSPGRETAEERRRTISPPGPLPPDLVNILN